MQKPLLPPTQLALFKPANPTHLAMRCTPRTLFGTEAILEHELMRDTRVHALLADLLATDVGNILNQVVIVNPDLRADLLLTGPTTNDRIAVAELQLDPLDTNHLWRGLTYASALNVNEIIYIAPGMESDTEHVFNNFRSWFSATNSTANLHFIRLTTQHIDGTTGGTYTLTPQTPPLPKPRRNRKTLDAIRALAANLGDTTLAEGSPYRDRRIDIYKGLKHLRIRFNANLDDTTITIDTIDTLAHKPCRTPINALTHDLADHLQHHSLTSWRSNPSTAVIATYVFPTPQLPDGTTDIELATTIARAYVTIRERLTHALAQLQPVPPQNNGHPTIAYRPADTN